MDPLKTYDYLATARGRLFDRVRPLDAASYAREFPIGPGSLARTLTHIMISEWYYVQRIEGRDVPPYARWPIREESPPPCAELEAAWRSQAGRTRAALAAVADWTTVLEYRVTTDEGRRQVVRASRGDLFTQLALHEVHHRAQAMNMLRHLGAAVGDLDFNTYFPRRDAEPGPGPTPSPP